MRNEWQVKIQYEMNYLGYAMYVYRELPSGEREFVTQNGSVKTVKNGAVKDVLWLTIFESTAQLRQLIEEAERQGVKAPTTERITGELEATKTHLEDMRRLVFDPPIEISQQVTGQLVSDNGVDDD